MPDDAERLLSLVVDPVWYRARNRDVAASGADPLRHFIDRGLHERRDPNRWFDGAWYTRQYADVAASGAHPLLHYMTEGAVLGRDPHPRFDAGWYVEQHPEAAGNPLLFHLRVGAARGWLTERAVAIEDFLPSRQPAFGDPNDLAVDVVVPVYRGLAVTRRCLRSVLADGERPPGQIIVVDDCSPEPAVSAWLDGLAKSGVIVLLRNRKNLGFVAAANLGMRHAGRHDVALLNSDTEVPSGWLRRLQAQAYARAKTASVSPLSNNATICSYLGYEGGSMPPGMTLKALDDACRAVNAGRFAETPTTVGFCMYIRREALDDVGLFDAKTFGKGYGEENDFCLRAAERGWSHHIACDTFVRHAGAVSFGAAADTGISRAYGILTKRYPAYAAGIARFVHDGHTEPSRFALTMAMFRASGLPTILAISHDQEGGVRRHVLDTVARDAGQANYLLLEPASRGLALSVPALPGHPRLVIAAERWRDVAAVIRSAGVTRAHVHHVMGLDFDVRALIHALGVRFDFTAHDYFAICPQVTLLPWSASAYCGEPGPAGCDACIAHRPSHGATGILAWRLRHAWLFRDAEHVNAPSIDTLNRLRRHAVRNARFMPHEGSAPVAPTRPVKPGRRLRVAVLGILADHKGAQLVASVVMAADPAKLDVVLIGEAEANFPAAARARMTITGRYREGELPALLTKYRPHVVWFPASWPETYSFTLSAALRAGLPIVASEIGAFPERLAGRNRSWLMPPSPDPVPWLALFDTVAVALRTGEPAAAPGIPAPAIIPARRGAETIVLALPERFDDGSFTPCAHIRLLHPLDHPVTGAGLSVTTADKPGYRADIIVTQRYAQGTIAEAEALAAEAKRTGAKLIYDLDDDLLNIPEDHPEAAELTPKAVVVERMIRLADVVRVSTEALGARIAPLARRVLLAPNALDERIWLPGQTAPRDAYGPVRLLCMGTATHDADFALIEPALTEIHQRFGDEIQLDLIGFVASGEVPPWIRRIAPPLHATRSYPGFVHWITRAGPWDIGLAPLADTAFNACKSPIKVLDYTALGLAVLASDVPAYRGSSCHLTPNTTADWSAALGWLIRDPAARRRLAADGTRRSRTLAAQRKGNW